jgi:tetratricopeptide (TPR) repeat protein/DNA-binding CsgD family transcriptional regulator
LTFSQRINTDSLKDKLQGAPDSTRVRILILLSEAYKSKEPLQAIDFGQKALELAQRNDWPGESVLALRKIGMAWGFNNDYPKAIEYLQKSSALADQMGDKKTVADNAINISSAYWVQNDYEQELKYLLYALELYESIGDKKGIIDGKASIGFYYLVAKQYDLALSYLSEAVERNLELNQERETARLFINIGTAYQGKNQLQKAMEYYVKALALFRKYDIKRGEAAALGAIGEVQFKSGQNLLAEGSIEEALRLSRLTNHQVAITDNLISLGQVLVAQKKFDDARIYLNEAIGYSQKARMKDKVKKINHLLSEIHEGKHNYEKALEYFKIYKLYYDSLESSEKDKKVKELQIKYESEKKEKEIEVLTKEKELSRFYLVASVTGFLVILLFGFLLVNRHRLKTSKDRALAEKENQLLEERGALAEAELLNQRLVQNQLRDQLEFKNKELTTYTLNLIQKNEALEKIKESVIELQNSPDEHFANKLNSLKNAINFSLHLDKDWDNFRAHFEQVHQNFFGTLTKICPDLSSNDLKLCALIKLNLATKETATIMDISPESAKVARHRLRKKLNLSPDQNLSAYLAQL